MRKSLSAKLEGAMKVNVTSVTEVRSFTGASSTDLNGFLQDLSMSVSVRTRKMVNYA